MAVRSLNNFRKLRLFITGIRRRWLDWRHGVMIAPGASLSMSATLIAGERGGIIVGNNSLIAFKTLLLARDMDGSVRPIRIGENCFIGGGSIILPGVTVGDGSIVGAGAVVFDDVPERCAVAGNPAKVIREGIATGRFGRLDYANENTKRLYR